MAPRRTPRNGIGSRQARAREDPHLVEDPVIGELVLEALRCDLAALEQENGVVKLAVLDPGGSEQKRRPAIGGRCRERFHGRPRLLLKHRLEHEVLGRVAGHDELGADHEVRTLGRRLGPRAQDQRPIALQIPHGGIELGERDGERIGHDRVSIDGGAGGLQRGLS